MQGRVNNLTKKKNADRKNAEKKDTEEAVGRFWLYF